VETPGAVAVPRGKLYGWLALVAVLAIVSYAARAGASDEETRNALYRYATAVGGAVQYALLLGFVLLIARGGDLRRLLALRPPRSWGRAAAYTVAALIGIWVVGVTLNIWLEAGEEQGLTPDRWEPDRAGAYAANFVVVAFFGPLVEELVFRGLGFTVVAAFFGGAAAVAATALAFGLAHGLVLALPVLVVFGVFLAWLRASTDSLYPPILLHMFFNASALVAAVTVLAT
jgi:membrane protease YdiL (CAAX protease family)